MPPAEQRWYKRPASRSHASLDSHLSSRHRRLIAHCGSLLGNMVYKIIDFGIAVADENDGGAAAGGAGGGVATVMMTEHNTAIGTAHFMSPEQHLGDQVSTQPPPFACVFSLPSFAKTPPFRVAHRRAGRQPNGHILTGRHALLPALPPAGALQLQSLWIIPTATVRSSASRRQPFGDGETNRQRVAQAVMDRCERLPRSASDCVLWKKGTALEEERLPFLAVSPPWDLNQPTTALQTAVFVELVRNPRQTCGDAFLTRHFLATTQPSRHVRTTARPF